MEEIALIDIGKYSGVCDRIRGRVVVLTDKQREHIIVRREKDFQLCYPHFKEVIEDPDYIFKDKKHNNTAVASKTLSVGGQHVNIVIRLAVEGDREDYLNSIITMYLESDKRYGQMLRNNIPLYKKEYL